MNDIKQGFSRGSTGAVMKSVTEGPMPATGNPALRDQDTSARTSEKAVDEMDDFEKYLNQTSITYIKNPKDVHQTDDVDLIEKNSIYIAPNLFST